MDVFCVASSANVKNVPILQIGALIYADMSEFGYSAVTFCVFINEAFFLSSLKQAKLKGGGKKVWQVVLIICV